MNQQDRYDSLIKWYAQANGLEWRRIKAQIKQESLFDPKARSHVGAKGLGQFMPPTWAEWGKGQDPFNPEANIEATCRYMRWLVDRFPGDYDKALAAYNWGIGNVRRVVLAHGDTWRNALPQETDTYLARINGYWGAYKEAA
jgi:soluble lytic murein transglycosylase-like protein